MGRHFHITIECWGPVCHGVVGRGARIWLDVTTGRKVRDPADRVGGKNRVWVVGESAEVLEVGLEFRTEKLGGFLLIICVIGIIGEEARAIRGVREVIEDVTCSPTLGTSYGRDAAVEVE